VAAGCADDETAPPPAPAAIFAADWATSYEEVRDCRRSADHDLNFIVVLADALARDAYVDRMEPFPAGAVILKAEYADPACSDLAGFTAMRRDPGFDPPDDDSPGGDWHWQRARADGTVSEDGVIARCKSCHEGCGVAPDGHDGTCAVP
jgi:hypothetical protein